MYNLYSRSHLSKIRNNALIEYTNKKIIIIGGDPNSINSELIYKSWKKINKSLKNKLLNC